tara:strand:+ start:7119 stop:7805 length:687 start_codon:yes stop_codon:yes gene_type:complete
MPSASVAQKFDAPASLRRERMRLILIEAATQLFADKGVDATTIDEIVVRAGVAKGTFYNYFLDRSEIAVAVAARIRHELNAAVAEINAGISDPAECVTRGVRLFMALVVTDPVPARMLARLYEGRGHLQSATNAHLLGDLERGIASGRFHVPNIEMALHVVTGISSMAMRSLIDLGAGPEILRGEGFAHDICVVLLQGLGVDAAAIPDILSRPFSIDGVRLIGHGRSL